MGVGGECLGALGVQGLAPRGALRTSDNVIRSSRRSGRYSSTRMPSASRRGRRDSRRGGRGGGRSRSRSRAGRGVFRRPRRWGADSRRTPRRAGTGPGRCRAGCLFDAEGLSGLTDVPGAWTGSAFFRSDAMSAPACDRSLLPHVDRRRPIAAAPATAAVVPTKPVRFNSLVMTRRFPSAVRSASKRFTWRGTLMTCFSLNKRSSARKLSYCLAVDAPRGRWRRRSASIPRNQAAQGLPRGFSRLTEARGVSRLARSPEPGHASCKIRVHACSRRG